jgi:hypothetical protein
MCGILPTMTKKISDENFLIAYLSCYTLEEVARRTGLQKSSVTDRAAALRKAGYKLPAFKKPRKSAEKTVSWLAWSLVVAVGRDSKRAAALLADEAAHGTASLTVALLQMAGSLDAATTECESLGLSPDDEADEDMGDMGDEDDPLPGELGVAGD